MALLRVRGLTVSFETAEGTVNAVNGVDLDVEAGQSLAVVGESGSGKSQLMFAIMGLLARNGTAGGSVELEGEEILGVGEAALNRVRSSRIAMVFQDPLAALDPRMTAGEIIAEPLVTHEPRLRRNEVRTRVAEAMERVGLPPGAAQPLSARVLGAASASASTSPAPSSSRRGW